MTTAHEQSAIRAFDFKAHRYDEEFESNTVTQKLRLQILDLISSLTPAPSRILDMNCGTGTDALALAERGHSVTGVDISSQMISQAKRKSSDNADVQFRQHSFNNLSSLNIGEFDLVLSNFGGLNCSSDLAHVSRQVSGVLRPGGYFVAVVMPPFSFWHFFAMGLRGHFGEIFRRATHQHTIAMMDSEPLVVTYHAASSLTKAMAHEFRRTGLFSLNIVSPPPYAKDFRRRYTRLSTFLEVIDRLIQVIPPFRSLGDHYVVVFQKEENR